MSIYRIAICDDVSMEREVLSLLLHECDKNQHIYQFTSGEELLCSRDIFDLIFLDIYMNGMTGMETAKALQNRGCKSPIVFLTSSPNYAVESYEVHAFDYIVKPLQPERLQEVWARFVAHHQHSRRFFLLNKAAKAERLPYEQIEFLESDGHYVTIHMADGREIRIQGKLDDLERQLDDMRFLRCHKSFLINLGLVKAMDDDFLMHSGKHVAYRKRDRKQIQKIFCDYMLR